MTEPHLDPSRKQDFVFLIEAVDSNPNGDPDNGGIPRTDPVSGQGLITDVAIKRKIRNTIALINSVERKPGYDIYVEAGVALNAQHERAYAPDGGQATDAKTAQAWMCRNFFDVRMFGAVMSTGKRDRQAGRVQGPVQIGFSRSVDPVTPFDIGITRVTPTRQEDVDAWNSPSPDGTNKGKETEMGSKHVIPYGLFKGAGHFSAPLAARTGVTSEDLAVFWRAFALMFEHDRAAARAGLALRGLYVFSHDDAFGKLPSHRLIDRVRVKPLGDPTARDFSAYAKHIEIDEAGLASSGVVMTPIVSIDAE